MSKDINLRSEPAQGRFILMKVSSSAIERAKSKIVCNALTQAVKWME